MFNLLVKRIPHIMGTIKKTSLPSNLLFFDTETRAKLNRQDLGTAYHYLWFGYAYAMRYEKGKVTRENDRYFKTIDSFWRFVKTRIDKNRPLYVFTHNLAFDLTIVDFWQQTEELGMDVMFSILEDPPTVIGIKWEGCSIYFVDTLNYWRMSLKVLGESVGTPKLEMPKGREINEEWSKYCSNDVVVLVESVKGLMDYIRLRDLGPFCMTQASQAMAAFKRRFMEHSIYVHDNKKVLELERDSYRGGLVHCFYIGEVKGKRLHHLDVNSLYPSVMLNPMPVRMVGSDRLPTLSTVRRTLAKKGGVATVRFEGTKQTYPYSYGERLIEATGTFTTTLCGPELVRALADPGLKDIYVVAYYDMAPIFTKFITYFYDERLRHKRNNDKVNDTFAKIFMNSLYGKFGQRGFEWVQLTKHVMERIYALRGLPFPKAYQKECPDFNLAYGHKMVWLANIDEPFRIRKLRDNIQIQLERGEHHESSPIVASYVTSYGRELLRGLIKIAGKGDVYYCDTDSLMVSSKGYDRLQRAGTIDQTKLGYLKYEGTTTSAGFYSPKDYFFGDKIVQKGIRANAIPIGQDEYLQDQFEGLASILKREPKPYIKIKWIVKHLKREYKKGIVSQSGWVSYIDPQE